MPSFDRSAVFGPPASQVALVAMGVLLWGLPAFAAQTDDICPRTGHLLVSMDFASEGNQEEIDRVSAAVNGPPGQYVDSCVQLKEQLLIQSSQGERKGQWFGFTPPKFRTVPPDPVHLLSLYDGCRNSSCGKEKSFSSLLLKVCTEELGRDGKTCDDELHRKSGSSASSTLPVWRKGLGGALIGVGGLAIVLGSIHLGVPLFRTEGGCIEYGLEHPCVADRFGVGGTLLGLGLAAVGGGILTLKLP